MKITRDYDIVMINGVLHYLNEKEKDAIIKKMKLNTKPGGINCISMFSTATPVPDCHKVVPVFPEDENGFVEESYSKWKFVYQSYERAKAETSHSEMIPHIHSFIKFIARRV